MRTLLPKIRKFIASIFVLKIIYYKLYRYVHFLKLVRHGPVHKGAGKSIILLNHNYSLDIAAIVHAHSNLTIWVLEIELFRGLHLFFPEEFQHYNEVYGSPRMRPFINEYKKSLIYPIYRRIKKLTNFSALLTPSDQYFWFRPFIETLQEDGYPILVQDKEGTLAPGAFSDELSAVIKERYPPIADLYMFWNESHRDFWVGVGLPKEKAVITGQPRSDFFFHPNRWPSKEELALDPKKKLLLFFVYDSEAYANSIDPSLQFLARPWSQLRTETFVELKRLLDGQKDLEIIVKAHPQQTDLADVRREMDSIFKGQVELRTGSSQASHLIANADVIVGFQTTAMMEAMFTQKPIIYAGWGPLADQLDSYLIPIKNSGGCESPSSAEEFGAELMRAVGGNTPVSEEMLRKRKEFRKIYFDLADGKVCERVLSLVESKITASSKRP